MKRFRHAWLFLLVIAGSAMASSVPPTRSGGELMREFEKSLAEPGCADASPRWRTHYAQAAANLADEDEVELTLFAYVLDEVRKARLPSELALIPFVETRFRADVRSTGGPAGLWQFTTASARRNGVRVQADRDGRMSVVSSTRAAVSHLRRLHRMFGHDWRQTAIAYNAGEGALKASHGKHPRRLSGISRSYPDKLHAIACLFTEQPYNGGWQHAIERRLPRLASRSLSANTRDLQSWARAQGFDPDLVIALNPGWQRGHNDVLAPVARPASAGRRGRRKAN